MDLIIDYIHDGPHVYINVVYDSHISILGKYDWFMTAKSGLNWFLYNILKRELEANHS